MTIGGVFSPKVSDSALARRFVAQNGTGYVSIGIFDGQTPVDAANDSIALKLYYNDGTAEEPGTLVFSANHTMISHDDVGKYSFEVGPEFTAARGLLTVNWFYEVNGKDFTYVDHLQVMEQMPLWERLSPEERVVVESVSWMFADSFDSTEGGPYLFETYQGHFNYERIAQLMRVALFRINTTGNPPTEFEVGGVPGQYTPVPNFMRGTLVIGTYIEVLKHLVRNYTEIPVFQQANVTFADRRDYQQRWAQVLQDEESGYKSMVIQAKRKLLGLGSTSILVGGGPFFGGSGGYAGSMWNIQQRGARFYPAAPALYGSLARKR